MKLRKLNEHNITSLGRAGEIAASLIKAAGGNPYLKTLLEVANQGADEIFKNLTEEQQEELKNNLQNNNAGKAPKYPAQKSARLIDDENSRNNNGISFGA